MTKKQDAKRSKKAEEGLSPEESNELGMILDRLLVQDPEGESLQNYLKSLRKALATRERLIAALIDKLSRNPSKVGFQAFLTLQDTVEDKQYRRLLKQAGYRFSQKGFAAEPGTAPLEKVVLIQKEVRKPIAHLIPIEGTFGFVAAIVPESGYPAPRAVTAFSEKGLEHLHVRVVESSNKLYREYIQTIADNLEGRKPCEVPLWHAARVFFELLDLHKTTESNAELDQARQLFRPFHDPQKPPYAYELMPPVEEPETHFPEVDLDELFRVVDMTWLIPPREELLPHWEKIQEVAHPVIVVPPKIKEERTLDLIRKAADELCVAERRLLFQRFFEEQALWLKCSSLEGPAMSCWIVAQHLAGASKASENPAVVEVIVLALNHYWPEDVEGEEAQDERFQQSESGLILPR